MIMYSDENEVLICDDDQEERVLAEYFASGSGRILDDYARRTGSVFELKTRVGKAYWALWCVGSK